MRSLAAHTASAALLLKSSSSRVLISYYPLQGTRASLWHKAQQIFDLKRAVCAARLRIGYRIMAY